MDKEYKEDKKQSTGTDALIEAIQDMVKKVVNEAMYNFKRDIRYTVKSELCDMRAEIARDVTDDIVKHIKIKSGINRI